MEVAYSAGKLDKLSDLNVDVSSSISLPKNSGGGYRGGRAEDCGTNRIAKYVALALALLPLMLCAGGARAADENGNFLILGVGATSCGKYLAQADSTNVVYIAWLTGYMTAIDVTTPSLRNILSGTDIDGAMGWINNFCQQNPTRTFSQAVRALTTFLRGTPKPVD